MKRSKQPSGHTGWDDYAPFYDWENARTFGRRDIPFWQRLVTSRGGRVLELGCGTGRVTAPLAKTGAATVVGIDRSEAMLTRGRQRLRRSRVSDASLLRGDIRYLPFRPGTFETVIAPYGVLQSLLRDRDFRLRYVIDTHIHADHVSGARRLAAGGGELCLHEAAQVAYPFRPLRDGQELDLGPLRLRVLHTPGHRPGVCRSPHRTSLVRG